MHYIGVDLAWGRNRPTGLAVLDEGGRLRHLSAENSDEAIVGALTPYVEGDCLVAIDAPLVVRNPTGNRPAEAELNKDFARFDAGAHPSNTGRRELGDEPRGARLAALLDLDIDPASTAGRRAIEVYPHPATVALFRLGRTLKYKHKAGRPLPRLRTELLKLVGHLEDLRDGNPTLHLDGHEGWKALVAQIESVERKADLRRTEDQVDAVVCAYVALFAQRHPNRTTTYGDLATGYIVTPTLPEGHRPAPRATPVVEPVETPTAVVEPPTPMVGPPTPMVEPPTPMAEPPTPMVEPPTPMVEPVETRNPVRGAVQEYAARQPELRKATDSFVDLVITLLDDAGINYLSVTGRAKSVASFAAKANRSTAAGPLYSDPLEQITDQIGVRVIAYLHSDVTAVADLLGDQLAVLDDRDMGQETANEGRFGYASRHLLVSTDPDRGTPATYDSLRGRRAQIQVRTILQHAWAEFEHAIRYKGTIPEEHVPDLDRRFTLAAGLLELADREFSLIRDRLQETVTDQRPEPDASDPRISAEDLATFLAAQYQEAGWSRTDHYAWISGLLLELAITSLDELDGLLTSVDSSVINERMGYRYPPGAVRRLDDALLAIFGERYVDLHGNAHRTSLLRARLEKLNTTDG